MFSAMSVFSQTQPNALPTNGKIGIGTATPSCELDVNGATSIDGTLIVKDSVRLEKKLIVDQDTRIKGKTIIDGNLRAKSNLKVVGNSRVDGNARVIGNEVVDGNIKAKSNLRVLGNSITEGNNRIDGNAKILGITKMKGDAFVEGDFKFKQLADPTAIADKWLTIDEDGKVKSLDKAGLLNLVYLEGPVACLSLGSGITQAPVWSNKQGLGGDPGVLYTNQGCPMEVGIRTSNPISTLDVRGTFHSSQYVGIGVAPQNGIKLYIETHGGTESGICLDMPNTDDYIYGYKIRLDNDKVKGIAINRLDTGEDVFRVYGDGRIEGKSLRLSQSIWADYVFEEDYKLLSIADLKQYIATNHHLPNVPTQEEVKENGVDVGNMNAILLEKLEEMSLYIIQLNEDVKALQEENKEIKNTINKATPNK